MIIENGPGSIENNSNKDRAIITLPLDFDVLQSIARILQWDGARDFQRGRKWAQLYYYIRSMINYKLGFKALLACKRVQYAIPLYRQRDWLPNILISSSMHSFIIIDMASIPKYVWIRVHFMHWHVMWVTYEWTLSIIFVKKAMNDGVHHLIWHITTKASREKL
jgi:hypothetical protein